MPPKPKSAGNTQIYVVSSGVGIDSIYASLTAAEDRVTSAKSEGLALAIDTKSLIGGTINITEEAAAKAAPKAKPAKATKSLKAEVKDEEEAPKSKTVAKKTKTPAEQRAANAEKPGKPSDTDLPDNVKALMKAGGNVFEGINVVVSGVPPTLGRKNAEKLVEAFGGHLTKSLSKKTGYVVIGNDAGPAKLEKIEELGLKTLDEDQLIAMLEKGGSNGQKRAASDDDEDGEEEKPKPKAKKRKK